MPHRAHRLIGAARYASIALVALAGCSTKAIEPLPSPGGGGAGGEAPVAYPDPYAIQVFDRTRINSKSEKENFQNAFADVDLGMHTVASAMLVIDLDTTCFPFESWADNPPPAGENWPADCDAFDRNFEWTLDPAHEETDPPGIELVRAITPFGGPRHLEVDITDVVNGVGGGMHELQAHITTWSDGAGQVSGSDGGWFVSAHIDMVPGPAPREVLAVRSLYNGSYGPNDVPPPQPFEVPEGTWFSRLEYRVTGHGGGTGGLGCVGPAEEFCQRTHTVSVDGEVFAEVIPWRGDCASFCTRAFYDNPNGGGFEYCEENPCGSIQSVEAPRANWCPGEVTPPFVFEPPVYPGEHTVGWSVNSIAEGGIWRTSVTYFSFGAP